MKRHRNAVPQKQPEPVPETDLKKIKPNEVPVLNSNDKEPEIEVVDLPPAVEVIKEERTGFINTDQLGSVVWEVLANHLFDDGEKKEVYSGSVEVYFKQLREMKDRFYYKYWDETERIANGNLALFSALEEATRVVESFLSVEASKRLKAAGGALKASLYSKNDDRNWEAIKNINYGAILDVAARGRLRTQQFARLAGEETNAASQRIRFKYPKSDSRPLWVANRGEGAYRTSDDPFDLKASLVVLHLEYQSLLNDKGCEFNFLSNLKLFEAQKSRDYELKPLYVRDSQKLHDNIKRDLRSFFASLNEALGLVGVALSDSWLSLPFRDADFDPETTTYLRKLLIPKMGFSELSPRDFFYYGTAPNSQRDALLESQKNGSLLGSDVLWSVLQNKEDVLQPKNADDESNDTYVIMTLPKNLFHLFLLNRRNVVDYQNDIDDYQEVYYDRNAVRLYVMERKIIEEEKNDTEEEKEEEEEGTSAKSKYGSLVTFSVKDYLKHKDPNQSAARVQLDEDDYYMAWDFLFTGVKGSEKRITEREENDPDKEYKRIYLVFKKRSEPVYNKKHPRSNSLLVKAIREFKKTKKGKKFNARYNQTLKTWESQYTSDGENTLKSKIGWWDAFYDSFLDVVKASNRGYSSLLDALAKKGVKNWTKRTQELLMGVSSNVGAKEEDVKEDWTGEVYHAMSRNRKGAEEFLSRLSRYLRPGWGKRQPLYSNEKESRLLYKLFELETQGYRSMRMSFTAKLDCEKTGSIVVIHPASLNTIYFTKNTSGGTSTYWEGVEVLDIANGRKSVSYKGSSDRTYIYQYEDLLMEFKYIFAKVPPYYKKEEKVVKAKPPTAKRTKKTTNAGDSKDETETKTTKKTTTTSKPRSRASSESKKAKQAKGTPTSASTSTSERIGVKRTLPSPFSKKATSGGKSVSLDSNSDYLIDFGEHEAMVKKYGMTSIQNTLKNYSEELIRTTESELEKRKQKRVELLVTQLLFVMGEVAKGENAMSESTKRLSSQLGLLNNDVGAYIRGVASRTYNRMNTTEEKSFFTRAAREYSELLKQASIEMWKDIRLPIESDLESFMPLHFNLTRQTKSVFFIAEMENLVETYANKKRLEENEARRLILSDVKKSLDAWEIYMNERAKESLASYEVFTKSKKDFESALTYYMFSYVVPVTEKFYEIGDNKSPFASDSDNDDHLLYSSDEDEEGDSSSDSTSGRKKRRLSSSSSTRIDFKNLVAVTSKPLDWIDIPTEDGLYPSDYYDVSETSGIVDKKDLVFYRSLLAKADLESIMLKHEEYYYNLTKQFIESYIELQYPGESKKAKAASGKPKKGSLEDNILQLEKANELFKELEKLFQTAQTTTESLTITRKDDLITAQSKFMKQRPNVEELIRKTRDLLANYSNVASNEKEKSSEESLQNERERNAKAAVLWNDYVEKINETSSVFAAKIQQSLANYTKNITEKEKQVNKLNASLKKLGITIKDYNKSNFENTVWATIPAYGKGFEFETSLERLERDVVDLVSVLKSITTFDSNSTSQPTSTSSGISKGKGKGGKKTGSPSSSNVSLLDIEPSLSVLSNRKFNMIVKKTAEKCTHFIIRAFNDAKNSKKEGFEFFMCRLDIYAIKSIMYAQTQENYFNLQTVKISNDANSLVDLDGSCFMSIPCSLRSELLKDDGGILTDQIMRVFAWACVDFSRLNPTYKNNNLDLFTMKMDNVNNQLLMNAPSLPGTSVNPTLTVYSAPISDLYQLDEDYTNELHRLRTNYREKPSFALTALKSHENEMKDYASRVNVIVQATRNAYNATSASLKNWLQLDKQNVAHCNILAAYAYTLVTLLNEVMNWNDISDTLSRFFQQGPTFFDINSPFTESNFMYLDPQIKSQFDILLIRYSHNSKYLIQRS